MKSIFDENYLLDNTCLSFGCFDGIHQGHKLIIETLKIIAKKFGLSSVVLALKQEIKSEKILTTDLEKEYLLNKTNIDYFISQNIKENFDFENFIKEIVVEKLDTKIIVVGKDYKYLKELHKFSLKYGFKIVECETVLCDGEYIDSNFIKKAFIENNIELVNHLLGHPYLICGKVVYGKQLGRTVGMPTANIEYSSNKLLPMDGVYGSYSEINGKRIKGLTNIGKRPSVDSFDYITVETFLLDFSGDLYGTMIALEIKALIRGVVKFKSLEEVKEQVNKDIESIRNIL